MYICLDCLKVFEEPKSYIETHGLDSLPYEIWVECPFCGGDYTDAVECSQCEKYIPIENIELLDEDFVCEDCFNRKSIGDDLD